MALSSATRAPVDSAKRAAFDVDVGEGAHDEHMNLGALHQRAERVPMTAGDQIHMAVHRLGRVGLEGHSRAREELVGAPDVRIEPALVDDRTSLHLSDLDAHPEGGVRGSGGRNAQEHHVDEEAHAAA